jgi:hypothetical protein
MSSYARIVIVTIIALACAAGPVLGQGVPDPVLSTVPDLLLTCPAGDIAFAVTVRDAAGLPCVNAWVAIDFCDCPEAQLCLYAGGEPCGNGKNDRLVLNTDANGLVTFHPAAGDICGGAPVQIIADGVVLAERIVRPMDVDGNFIVEAADFTYDNILNDYNGDGFANLLDLAVFSVHAEGPHMCEAPIPEDGESWGGVKALWR